MKIGITFSSGNPDTLVISNVERVGMDENDIFIFVLGDVDVRIFSRNSIRVFTIVEAK